ncbi:MAG TPA: LysM peptidoglycan-binding domain-containing protein [Pantanalinema sp.]
MINVAGNLNATRIKPQALPEANQTHVVRKGDTLWDISAAKLGDATRWPEIHELNKSQIKDPDLIYPGQVLKLPTLRKPSQPTKPSVPAQPPVSTKPTQPTQPTKPSVPAQPPVSTKPTQPTKPPVCEKPGQGGDVILFPTKPTQPTKPSQPTKPADPKYPTVGEYVKDRFDKAVDSTVDVLHGAAELALPPVLLGEMVGIKAKNSADAYGRIWDLEMDPAGNWKNEARKIRDEESAEADATIRNLPGVRAIHAAGDAIEDAAEWTGDQLKAGAKAVAEVPKGAARGAAKGIGGIGEALTRFSNWALGGLK